MKNADLQNFAAATATREMAAYDKFVECCMGKGFTRTEADKILTVYRKFKVVKLDRNSQVWNVTHGAFWDVETLKNALSQ